MKHLKKQNETGLRWAIWMVVFKEGAPDPQGGLRILKKILQSQRYEMCGTKTNYNTGKHTAWN